MTRAKDWAVRSEARGGLARDATLPLSTLPPDLQAVLEHATLLVTQSATAHDQVWPPVLEALIRTAPGIEGATLAVRDGEHFVIRAQHGYAPDLLGLELPLYAERAWYGLSDQDWRDGRARLLEEEEVQAHVGWMKRTLGHLPHYARLERFGRLPEMRCSLLVPLVLDGEVRAHLNLDGYAGPALGAAGSASWVQGCTALLTMLLAVVNSARRAGQFQRLREERDALRVHLQLSERLRRCTQHDEILQVGLRLIQEGFAAETGLLIGPAHVTCTDGRTVNRAALRPSPLGYTVLAAGVLGHPEALELLTVPCGDGHVLGLAWRSGHIRQPDLVTAALLDVAERAEQAAASEAQHATLRQAKDGALFLAGLALEARDLETSGHTERVVALAAELGAALGLSDEEVRALHAGAALHDIGKLSVPDALLLKSGPLSEDEWVQMRRHPDLGAAFARRVPGLPQGSVDVIRHHHERWDGRGYPLGLAGQAIPRLARIFSVVDAYDALTSVRPYKVGWAPAEALRELQAQSGRQFDPHVVQVFCDRMAVRAALA